MKHSRKEEDLGGFTLSQLLALKPTGEGGVPVWHPNGNSIYFKTSKQDNKSILSINLNNGKIKNVSDHKGGLAFLSPTMLTCSSNGQWLAYLNNAKNLEDRKSSNRNEIWLQSTSVEKAIQLTTNNSNINAYAWS